MLKVLPENLAENLLIINQSIIGLMPPKKLMLISDTELLDTITNSEGNEIPVRLIGEQHVREDCGRIPSVQDWLQHLQPQNWMVRGYPLEA